MRCGRKVRRHWVIPGLIRFNGAGDFNPHLPNRSLGCTFLCSDLTFAFGGNRLLFGRKVSKSEIPESYLVALSSELHGRMDFSSDAWRSSAAVIAVSQLREKQEVMLLMAPGDWVRTSCGFWQLTTKDNPRVGMALELIGEQDVVRMTIK